MAAGHRGREINKQRSGGFRSEREPRSRQRSPAARPHGAAAAPPGPAPQCAAPRAARLFPAAGGGRGASEGPGVFIALRSLCTRNRCRAARPGPGGRREKAGGRKGGGAEEQRDREAPGNRLTAESARGGRWEPGEAALPRLCLGSASRCSRAPGSARAAPRRGCGDGRTGPARPRGRGRSERAPGAGAGEPRAKSKRRPRAARGAEPELEESPGSAAPRRGQAWRSEPFPGRRGLCPPLLTERSVARPRVAGRREGARGRAAARPPIGALVSRPRLRRERGSPAASSLGLAAVRRHRGGCGRAVGAGARPLVLEPGGFEGLLRGAGPEEGVEAEPGSAGSGPGGGGEGQRAGEGGRSRRDAAWQRAEGHAAAPGAGEGPAEHRSVPTRRGLPRPPRHPRLRRPAFPSPVPGCTCGQPPALCPSRDSRTVLSSRRDLRRRSDLSVTRSDPRSVVGSRVEIHPPSPAFQAPVLLEGPGDRV